MIERSWVRNPAGAVGESSSPGSAFCTAVACKRSRSFCQKCRWQVTAQHACTLYMWLWIKWHSIWLYSVHITLQDGCSFIWHQPCLRCKCTTSVDIFFKAHYKKLVIHVDSHARERRMALYKSNQQEWLLCLAGKLNHSLKTGEWWMV